VQQSHCINEEICPKELTTVGLLKCWPVRLSMIWSVQKCQTQTWKL